MGLVVQEIDQDVDFPALARCLLEAYEDPPQKFLHIFFPINGSGAEAREAAIQEAAERLKLWHTHDPTSHWQKVVDIDTGRLVGGASWNVYTTNPFTEPHALDVTWFPDDSSRVYVEKALENYGLPRAEVAQKPHIYLFNVFIHPDYRRHGAGQQVLDWGMKKADELGLDVFLDATPPGKPLYEANGFICLKENITKPTMENPDEKWKEMENKVGAFTFWLMQRPANKDKEHTQ